MPYITEKPGIMSWTHNPFSFRPLFCILIILVLAMAMPVSAAVHTINPGDSIQQAITDATAGDTIILNPGTYNQHDITISKNMNIGANTTAGGTAANTIIDAQSLGRIFNVGGYSLTIDNLTLLNGLITGSGDGGAIVFTTGTVNVTSSSFINCSAAHYGGAIFFTTGGNVNIISSSFTNCSATAGGAIFTDNGNITVTSSTFTNCSAPENGPGYGGAIFAQHNTAVTVTSSTFTNCTANQGGAIATNSETLKITSSTFTNCSAKYSATHTQEGWGGAIYTTGNTNTANVTSSTFTNCSASRGGAIFTYYGGTFDIHFSRIYNSNTTYAVYNTGSTIDASNNWWGTNANPSGYTSGTGVVTVVSPWLVLGITAVPSSIATTQTSTILANMTYNSAGINTASGGIFVPDGIKNTFGIITGSGTVSPGTNLTINGVSNTTFTPSGSSGARTISATVDGQMVSTGIMVTVSPTPVAAFTGNPRFGAAPLTVQFNDSSTNTPNSWNWTFGDGSAENSTMQNPIHTYLNNGSYSVTLNATNAVGGNSTTKSSYILVGSMSRTGIFRGLGYWYLDMNNNGTWDSTPTDKEFYWGKQPGDIPVTGDWTGDGVTETGIFRAGGHWYLDMNNNGTWDSSPTDKEFYWGKQPGDLPITGDWNGNGITETGIFRAGGHWYLDMNNNGTWDGSPTDTEFYWGKFTGDIPITGDWNGDMVTETGIFRPGTGFYLDMNNNGTWDSTPTDKVFYWVTQPGDIPITGDWTGDGITKIGVFRPGTGFYLDMNNNGQYEGPSTDIFLLWGLQLGDKPITGRW